MYSAERCILTDSAEQAPALRIQRDVEAPSPAIYIKDKRGLRVSRRPLFLMQFCAYALVAR